MKQSSLFKILMNTDGVSNAEEMNFLLQPDGEYSASGLFDFSSTPDKEPYIILYRAIKKSKSVAISFRLIFVFEELQKSMKKDDTNRYISFFNQHALGIKATPVESNDIKDDEIAISFSVEFFTPEIPEDINYNTVIRTNLNHLELSPYSFSQYLKASDIKHDYLVR